MTRRDEALAVVRMIVISVGRKDPCALQQQLKKSYPFGERNGYPYRVWLDVIREEIGGMRPRKPDPRQLTLF